MPSQTNSTDPVVSVIMRTRDRTLLLRRGLQSVADQRYRPIELVIVNDGGDPDPVEAAIRSTELASIDLVRVDNEESVGREQALNVGVQASSGQLIAVLDDDDTWDPRLLERVVPKFADDAVAGVVVPSDVVRERIEGDEIVTIDRERLTSGLETITVRELLEHNVIPTNGFVYRRSAYDEIGGYDGSLPVLADWDFNRRFIARHPIALLDGEPLANWHHRERSVGWDRNSVFANDDHERYRTILRERQLRATLAQPELAGLLETVIDEFVETRALINGRITSLHERMKGLEDQLAGIHDNIGVLSMHLEQIVELGTRRNLAHIDGMIDEMRAIEARTPSRRAVRLARRLARRVRRLGQLP